MSFKLCLSCLISKYISDFDIGRNQCKDCRRARKRLWENSRRKNSREQYNKYSRNYYKNNSEKKKASVNLYRENNVERVVEARRKYYIKNRVRLINNGMKYRKDNKIKIRKMINKWKRQQRALNPTFKLRDDISRTIRRTLKQNGSSKNGNSILQFLQYTIVELQKHLEKQFESWMTWDNHGIYDAKNWDDNNPATWTWQLDHIIPQSDLLYISMTDDNFYECWGLSNLRPLSAKQNYLDGMRKIRHKGRK